MALAHAELLEQLVLEIATVRVILVQEAAMILQMALTH